MNARSIVILSFALTLMQGISGCQKNIDYKTSMDNAKDCCKSYADIHYQKLTFDEALNYDIGDADSPTMDFPEGKSFYMAAQFPPFRGPFEVQIDSIPQNNKLFVPTLLLLNKQFEVTRQIEDSAFEYSNGNSSYNFFINEEDRKVRYMILYTRSSIIGKEHKSVTTEHTTIPIFAGAYVFIYTDHNEVKNRIINARGGRLHIKAKEYKLRNINDNPDTTNDTDS